MYTYGGLNLFNKESWRVVQFSHARDMKWSR